MAHRDLDAVCALFEVAAKAEEQRGHTSVAIFLDTLTAQQIPADTLAERGVRGDAVRLLTAHRVQGPGVAASWSSRTCRRSAWPDLRRRATLLQADRIGHDGLLPPLTTQALLAEERRLFYVACTRARAAAARHRRRRRPTTTASSRPASSTSSASASPTVRGRPSRPLSLAGLVAELRRTVADPAASPALRDAAAARLARLSLEEHRGRPLAPQADPADWWGTRARTLAATPLRPADEPVTMSASTLEALLHLPARSGSWSGRPAARRPRPPRRASAWSCTRSPTGSSRATSPATRPVDDLMRHVDRVWGQLPFRTPWSATKERAEVEAALTRFVQWHGRPGARTVLATEQRVQAEVTLPDGQRGRPDRVSPTGSRSTPTAGWSSSTSRPPSTRPTDKELATNPQLGLYQLAVDARRRRRPAGRPARARAAPSSSSCAGASAAQVKVQQQPPQQPGEDGRTAVEPQLDRGRRRRPRPSGSRPAPATTAQRCAFQSICPVKGAGTVLS